MKTPHRIAHVLTLAACLLTLASPLAAEPTATPELPALELAPVDEEAVEITLRPCEAGMRFEIVETSHQIFHVAVPRAWGEVDKGEVEYVGEQRATAKVDRIDEADAVQRLTLRVDAARATRRTVGRDDATELTQPIDGHVYSIVPGAQVERTDGADLTGDERDRALWMAGPVVCPNPWFAGVPTDRALAPGDRFEPDAAAVARAHAGASTVESPSLVYRGVREVDGARRAVFAIAYAMRSPTRDGWATTQRAGELEVDPVTGAVVFIVSQGESDYEMDGEHGRTAARGMAAWTYRATVRWPMTDGR